MGLSYDDAARLGIEKLHPNHPGNTPPAKSGGRPRITGKNAKGQNKTEARFDDHLAVLLKEDWIAGYEFEPLKLKIGPRTFLTMDFVIHFHDPKENKPVLIDVKGGPLEDDCAVKLKVAASQFAWLAEFWIVREVRRGEWESQEVHPVTGIRKPIPGDAWLGGEGYS